MPGQLQVEYSVVPTDTVLYAGQPLGAVIAQTRAAAEDGLDLVEIDIEPLAAVIDAHAALAPRHGLLHPDWGTNVAVEADFGDPVEAVEAALAAAPHVLSMDFHLPRQFGSPIETRGVVAQWEAGLEELRVWSSTQTPHHCRDHLAGVLGLRVDQVRVIAPDVGGGFGNKEHLYPDEVIVCLAAMRTGRPVKWIEDRRESFTATLHARDQFHTARIAYDDEGRLVALHSDILMDLGAHPSNVGSGPGQVAAGMLPGPYRFASVGAHLRCVLTNKAPVGALRGFGQQQATWVRERLVDEVARRLGITPLEIRRRNMLRSDELPHMTRTFQQYDSGDYPRLLEMVAARLDDLRAGLPQDGRLRGVGLASHVEFTGLGPSRMNQIVGFHLMGSETAVVRVDIDGTATVSSGVSAMGQGIDTTLGQLVGDRLGLPMARVRVLLGDTAIAPYSSGGSIASRSITVGGGAAVLASEKLRSKILAIAAYQLESDPEELEILDGRVSVRGAPFASKTFAEIASSAWLGWDLPPETALGLEEKQSYDPPDVSYSSATHGAIVSVDEESGVVRVEHYVVAHDCGVVVNPMIVDGQIHGGVAQGIGAALLEEMVYDTNGQPLTTTYMDYLLPTSSDVPDILLEHIETPSPFTPGGMKGIGEGGAIVPPAAIGNALCDAIPEIAHLVTELPMTPPRVWGWIQQVRGRE